MVFERPKLVGQRKRPPTQQPAETFVPEPPRNKKGRQGGDYPPAVNNRKGDGNGHEPPSPWLIDPIVDPDTSASFVEYLRWMRSPTITDKVFNNSTKVQLLQIATTRADYRESLNKLTERTRQIAGKDNCFEVSCPWRIRVGGHRGPESILLPAFDAVGMPYIPSATLRGVARTQAIRQFMAKDGGSWKEAEEKVAPWFGSLDEKGSDHTGKIIFFDAYPLPRPKNNHNKDNEHSGGLKMDMANNIWNWSDGELTYKSNPNAFLSLAAPTFVIGLRPTVPTTDRKIITQVQHWLKSGLSAGIGSQVNTGYGVLGRSPNGAKPFLQVPFAIEGQLMHGHQQVNWNTSKRRWDTSSQDEVRPVAMKSILRYWFRALCMGVLPIGETKDVIAYHGAIKESKQINPPATVKALEALLFGSISPQYWGWLTVRVAGETVRPSAKYKNDACGKQVGNLSLLFAPGIPKRHIPAVKDLCKALVWLTFHLGSVGQGARRPCYSRMGVPCYRGSTLIPDAGQQFDTIYGTTEVPGEGDSFWGLPETVQSFRDLFQERLKLFYSALGQLTESSIVYERPIEVTNIKHPHEWVEAVDSLCRIIVVKELESKSKPTALGLLHKQFHTFENKGDIYSAKNLCGHTLEDKVPPLGQSNSNRPIKKVEMERQKTRKAIPSPIWVTDLDSQYQVITVFGASQNPRKQFLNDLEEIIPSQCLVQIWPMV